MNKPVINIVILCSLMVLMHSCRKQPAGVSGMVRSYEADHHTNVLAAMKLDDGNFIMVSSYLGVSLPGELRKISSDGAVLWKKRLQQNNITLIKAIPINGQGFLTYGYRDFSGYTVYLNLYDYSGNIIKTDSITSNIYNWSNNHGNIIQLNDGNLMLVQTFADYPQGFVRVHMYSPNLKRTKVRTFYNPVFYTFMQSRAMCQTADGSVQIAVTAQENWDDYLTLLMLRFSESGDFISSKRYFNSDSSISISAAIHHKDAALMVSSGMKGLNWGSNEEYQNNNGCMVDYNSYGGYESYVPSGRIGLRTLNDALSVTGIKSISGYRGNGLIRSINRIADGGYILCGTVNQLGTTLVTSYTQIYLLRIDAELNTLWSKIIPTTYPAIGCNAIPTDDGGILVFGTQKSLGLKSNALIIKTDPNGNY